MKFRVVSKHDPSVEWILPQGDFSLVFHDTETLIQIWSSDGVIDEIPVKSVKIIEEKTNEDKTEDS